MATSTIKPKRGTTAQWARSERILEWNEWGVEETVSGDWILRVGDGEHEFLDLPKVIDTPSLNELVAEAQNTYNLFFDKAEEMEDRFEELSAEITSKHETAISDIETKGAETLATIPEDYTETYNRAVKNSRDIEFVASTATRNDKRLTNIEKALSDDKFSIDSSVAYTKDVPEDALPYAEVTEIGGMTRKCTNKCDIQTLTVEARSEWLNLKNPLQAGRYTLSAVVSSTDTDRTSCLFIAYNNLTEVKYIYIPKISEGVRTSVTFVIDQPVTRIQCYASEDYPTSEGDSATFMDIQINEGDIALPYEPYFEGLRSAPVTEVESVGVNLIPFPYKDTTETLNGITWKVNADGSISAKGTATNMSYRVLSEGIKFSESEVIADQGKTVTVENMTFTDCRYNAKNLTVSINISPGETVDKTYYPMINKGTEPLPYTPYVRNTLAIPEAIQNIDGYGWGVNDEVYNYVDWEKKQFVKRVGKVVLDGTENWVLSISSGYPNDFFRLLGSFGAKDTGKNKISSHYKQNPSSWSSFKDGEFDITSGMLGFTDSRFESAESFKGYLAEQYANGNPLTVFYELAEPVTTDISDLLPADNLIGVEGGGTVTMVNEYEYNVPSEVVYRLKEGESA